MAEKNNTQSLVNYLPHVLFVFAQILCGTFFILLIVPLINYLIFVNYNFLSLLQTFPNFWQSILEISSFSNLFIWIGISFPIGICLAESFYQIGRRVKYINDLGLEDGKRDATKEEQIELFISKCRLQKYPEISRIWEWENFQSNLFFYAESISILFIFFMALSIILTLFLNFDFSTQKGYMISCLVLWIFAVLFFMIMRKGRESKYDSFRLANQAIQKMLDEQSDFNEKVTTDNHDSSLSG